MGYFLTEAINPTEQLVTIFDWGDRQWIVSRFELDGIVFSRVEPVTHRLTKGDFPDGQNVYSSVAEGYTVVAQGGRLIVYKN